MNTFYELIGEGTENLTAGQMMLRSLIIFLIGLLFIRLAGRRSFGMRSAFDNVIGILLGAILSRAVVGASPFWPTVCAALVIAALHRLFAWISIYSDGFGGLIKGNPKVIYKDGRLSHDNMKRCLITDKDLVEGLRKQGNTERLEDVKAVYVERDGTLSVVK